MSKYIKEGAELVEGRMTFIQDFLQKKYAFGILFLLRLINRIDPGNFLEL